MKNVILLVLVCVFGINQMNSQTNFRFGVNGGIPVGDAGDFTTFQLGADAAYLYDFMNTIELGGLIGYSHYFGEEMESNGISFDVDDVQFLPLAVTGRVSLLSFFAGADLGYAIGLNEGNDGGFFYRPKVGYNFLMVGVILSYSGVARDGNNFSSVNLGVEIGL